MTNMLFTSKFIFNPPPQKKAKSDLIYINIYWSDRKMEIDMLNSSTSSTIFQKNNSRRVTKTDWKCDLKLRALHERFCH